MSERTVFSRIIETSAYVQAFAVREHLYLLSDRRIQVWSASGEQRAEKELFEKDGLARSFIMDENWIYCSDFCDLSILDTGSLDVVAQLRLGVDLSSDINGLSQDEHHVYARIRNGAVIRISKGAWECVRYDSLSTSSMWAMQHEGARIYAGNVDGQLLVIDAGSMRVEKTVPAHKQNLKSVRIMGSRVITAAQDKALAVWDRQTLEQLQIKKNAHKKAFSIVGVWQGHILTVAFSSGEIKVWDGATLQERNVVPITPCLSGQACIVGARLYLASRAIPGIDCAEMERIVR